MFIAMEIRSAAPLSRLTGVDLSEIRFTRYWKARLTGKVRWLQAARHADG